MPAQQRILATLALPKQVPALLARAKAIHAALNGNAMFPNPTPQLTVFSADIAALDTAESDAQSRAKGSAEARDVKKRIVIADLEQLRTYVQIIADQNPSESAAVIAGAMLDVRKAYVRHKPALQIIQGDVSGMVRIVALAVARRASYNWAWSVDEKNWTLLPSTLQARTVMHGLTPATVYYFRFQTVTKAGVSDWSQAVWIMVK